MKDEPALEEDTEISFSSNSLESLSARLLFLATTFSLLGAAFTSFFFSSFACFFGAAEVLLDATFFVAGAFLFLPSYAGGSFLEAERAAFLVLLVFMMLLF